MFNETTFMGSEFRVRECLLNKISRSLMAYGGVEYTYKYTLFCINIRRILL